MKLFPSIRPVIHPWMASCDPSIHGWYHVTHPSVPSSIHGCHHTGKKTLAEINHRPPLRMCRSLGKACPAPVSGLLPWSAVFCYLTGHKQCNIKIFSGQGPDGYMRNVVHREVLEMLFVVVIL